MILPRTITLLRENDRCCWKGHPRGLDLSDVRRHLLELDHVEARARPARLPGRQPACRCSPRTSSSTSPASRTGTARRCSTSCSHCLVAETFDEVVEHLTFQLEERQPRRARGRHPPLTAPVAAQVRAVSEQADHLGSVPPGYSRRPWRPQSRRSPSARQGRVGALPSTTSSRTRSSRARRPVQHAAPAGRRPTVPAPAVDHMPMRSPRRPRRQSGGAHGAAGHLGEVVVARGEPAAPGLFVERPRRRRTGCRRRPGLLSIASRISR